MQTYNVEQLAEILHLSKNSIYYLLRNNMLPSTKIGRQYIVTDENLRNWLKYNEGKEVTLWHAV